ncbi:uncharacterized protein LOC111349731 [Spodoptera litura]|uniref:Uncharacterized protein LOC111349731 n=1 Tax=Spodoptera litura TaxID=69820 RepID=A0A9J7IIT7_SPOLT|nr:uncharacterized protein LOC111349731 [Spodoptera litura]
MWKLLLLLAVLANIFSLVSSAKESETTIITSNVAAAAASGVVVENGENGSVAAGAAAAAAASSTTIIKTEHHVRKCAVNERYSKCPEKLCQPQVCEEVGIPQCSIHDERYFDKTGPCPGPPACICVEGFVRNDEGVCMPAKECPSCGNDKNATSGCGVNCGRRCSNYMLSNVTCADICYSNNCDCKEDYVFDDYLGFCVLPQDCSNKNAPEPEGTDGTPGNEDGNESTDPCDDCSENNCDNTNENTDDIEEIDCNGMDGETTTKSEMNSSSTTESNEGSDSTTEASGMTTEGSAMRSTTRRPRTTTKRRSRTTTESDGGSDMTTKGSGISSTTRNNKISIQVEQFTTESGAESNSTTERSIMTTDNSGNGPTTGETESNMTTEDSGNGPTTGETETDMTTEDSGNGPTTGQTETDMTTEQSENGSNTEDSENGTTTEDFENGTTTEEMDTGMTTEKSEAGSTTEEAEGDMTTKDSESESTIEEMETSMTTEDSGNEGTTEQSPSSQRTTTNAPISTTRRTRKPRTTIRRTRTTTKRRTTSSAPETTMKSTTRRPRRTTTKSASETTTEASTTKGPKDCKGRNEWYFDCAPSCPQRTCEDYLNGVRCQASDRTTGCKPECRCMIGYYKDAEGNCVSTLQCRQSSSNTGMTSTTTTSTTTTSTTAEPTCEEEAIPLFAVGSLRYTLRILYEISLSNPGNSVMVGGASVLYLMGELALYAKGRAKTELLNVFNLQETEQISCAFPRISAALTAQYPDIEFSLFCKIYADDDCPMTDDFIQNTEKIFAMAPQNLNFSASDAAKTISDEVENMTNGNFENYLKTRTISTLDHLVMIDAEGFQGKWEKQFNPADTTLKDFFWSGRISKVQSMYQKDTFLYGESSVLGAKILKMDYVGGMFGLVIFLPNSLIGLNDLLRKLQQNTNVVYSAVGSLTMQMVEIDLPKFEISVANRLKIPSEKAGVTRIFSNTSLGLENVASCEMPYVSEILQKITFHVDEYGMGETRDVEFAPIATTQAPRRQQTYRFKADHPFVYSLFHKEVMLQAGIFAGN